MSAKRVKTSAEERIFMFSSESVNEGHPDKVADQVSDAVLDACLTADPYSKVRASSCLPPWLFYPRQPASPRDPARGPLTLSPAGSPRTTAVLPLQSGLAGSSLPWPLDPVIGPCPIEPTPSRLRPGGVRDVHQGQHGDGLR
jgi:hypothetical protein